MNSFEYIVVSITTRCNMSCNGCFKIHSSVPDLMPDIFSEIINLSKNIGCKYINFSGGEPLLNPNWDEFLRICYESNITPMLSTNGLLLSNLKNGIFFKLGVLAIPLDGPNSSINDRIRCDGHFSKIVNLINEYKDGDFPFTLKINTLVTKANMFNLDPIAKYLLNDRRIVWTLFQESSRGNHTSIHDTSISKTEFLDVVNRYTNSSDIKCRITHLCADSAAEYLIISPDGYIFMPDFERYAHIGSYKDTHIVELIRKYNSAGNTFRKLILGES